MSNHKVKRKAIDSNTLIPLVLYFDKAPLIDTLYKVAETISEFDLYELHNWEKKK